METSIAVERLAALAQVTRLEIFRTLVRAGSDGVAAGAIGERLGLPGATLSFHLSHLKQADLVTCRRRGRSLLYAAAYDKMDELLGYLTENCCRGDDVDLRASCCRTSEAIALTKGGCS